LTSYLKAAITCLFFGRRRYVPLAVHLNTAGLAMLSMIEELERLMLSRRV